MAGIYKLMKLAGKGAIPGPVKLLGLWLMHVTGRRVIGVFMDPVSVCNLRCKMCYFSDEEKRRQMHGRMTDGQLAAVERALLPRALKLQIGCGAEPTLDTRLTEIVRMGRRAGVPYVSLTTNGQLLVDGRISVMELADAGLNEITLSMHGTSREVYEQLMPGADFGRMLRLIEHLREVKARHPEFVIRVNFTVNSLNIHDLENGGFWRPWGEGFGPDVVQLRPVQNLGVSEWRDFDPEPLLAAYDGSFGSVIADCAARGITCVAPAKEDIVAVASGQEGVSAVIEDLTYCYVSADSCYKADFDMEKDTYNTYHKRRHTARRLWKSVFTCGGKRAARTTKKLNYRVR